MQRTLLTAVSWLALAGLAGFPATEAKIAEVLSAEVVGVSDGDCILVSKDGDEVEVRLEGIDAPEDGQAFFEVARQGLEHAVLGKVVDVRISGRDEERRLLGRVYLADVDVNLELVKAGLAWHDRQRSPDKALRDAQKQARKDKKGLWGQKLRPVAPWDYRLAQEESREERDYDQLGYTQPRRPDGG